MMLYFAGLSRMWLSKCTRAYKNIIQLNVLTIFLYIFLSEASKCHICKFYGIASNSLQAIQIVHELFDCPSYEELKSLWLQKNLVRPSQLRQLMDSFTISFYIDLVTVPIVYIVYNEVQNKIVKQMYLWQLTDTTIHRQCFFHRQPTHRYDHWPTRQVTDKYLKKIKKNSPTYSPTFTDTHRQLLFLENEWKKIT